MAILFEAACSVAVTTASPTSDAISSSAKTMDRLPVPSSASSDFA
jgi:hypothetical protein